MTPDWKIYGPCFRCKRKKLFVRKRKIPFPVGNLTVSSRELFCTPCTNIIAKEIQNGILK